MVDLNRVANAIAAAVLLVPVWKIVAYQIDHPPVRVSDPRLWPSVLRKPVLIGGIKRPDVYFIIPDDYARADVLKQYFHYDASGFIHQLEKRGFVVADQVGAPTRRASSTWRPR